ncbi:MAG: hypothetical protein F9K22_12365 [Bacteroidetes bacterium]|nr:MAG: hypothetical protein F9K22_12365 [Bacteroidota bacterium]
MKRDEVNSLLDRIRKHEGPRHPGFVSCELRSLEPAVLAYTFDSPKHAAAFVQYQQKQGDKLRHEHDTSNESVVLEYR